MKLIESKTLASAAAQIEFTSIPQDGTDLVALVSTRLSFNNSGSWYDMLVRFNGSTSNYSGRLLYGTGSGGFSLTETSIGIRTNATGTTADTFGNTSLYVPNYAGATNKSVSHDAVSENNATLSWQAIGAALWSDTSAITSMTFIPVSGNLEAGSTISLYKITKGSDGLVTVS
jgi:hypothetical protein